MKNTLDTLCRNRSARFVHGKRLVQMAFRAMRGYGQYQNIRNFIETYPHLNEMYTKDKGHA